MCKRGQDKIVVAMVATDHAWRTDHASVTAGAVLLDYANELPCYDVGQVVCVVCITTMQNNCHQGSTCSALPLSASLKAHNTTGECMRGLYGRRTAQRNQVALSSLGDDGGNHGGRHGHNV